jgi:hypothetical protein
MLAKAQSSHLELQHYKILFICGRSSSRLDRNTSLEVHRAFTAFQHKTILEENHHSFLIVEYDPLLYEDAGEMVEHLAQLLKQTSWDATVRLYAPTLEPHLQKLTELTNLWCSASTVSRPRKGRRRCREPRERERHTHEVALEARGEVDQAQAGAVFSTRVHKPGDGQATSV